MTPMDLKSEFYTTSIDILNSIEEDILKIEKSSFEVQKELLNDIFRHFHTLKGNAKTAGLKGISDLAHKVENLLDKLRKDEIKISDNIIDIILFSKDVLLNFCENSYYDEQKAIQVMSKINSIFESKNNDKLSYVSGLINYLKKLYKIIKTIENEKKLFDNLTQLYFTTIDLKNYLIGQRFEDITVVGILEDFLFLVKENNIEFSKYSFNIINHIFFEIFKKYENDIIKYFNIKKIDCDINSFIGLSLSGLSNIVIFNLDRNIKNLSSDFFIKLFEFKNSKEKIIICSDNIVVFSKIRYFKMFKNLGYINLYSDYKKAIIEQV